MSTDFAATPPAKRTRAELYSTVFLTGAAVMVVEILGTRIIGPVFGVSLFIWTALLIVTLTSLAIGYYAGGFTGKPYQTRLEPPPADPRAAHPESTRPAWAKDTVS